MRTFGRSITLQLIGNDHAWDVLKPLEQFAEKSFGGMLIATTLYEDIQHISVLIYRSPQILSFATDREKHLVQMPLVATMRTATPQLIGVRLPELQAPLPYRFIAYNESRN